MSTQEEKYRALESGKNLLEKICYSKHYLTPSNFIEIRESARRCLRRWPYEKEIYIGFRAYGHQENDG